MRLAVLDAEGEAEASAPARTPRPAGTCWASSTGCEAAQGRRRGRDRPPSPLEEAGARDALAEAFEDLKKYEQVAETTRLNKLIAAAKRETAALDELGLRRRPGVGRLSPSPSGRGWRAGVPVAKHPPAHQSHDDRELPASPALAPGLHRLTCDRRPGGPRSPPPLLPPSPRACGRPSGGLAPHRPPAEIRRPLPGRRGLHDRPAVGPGLCGWSPRSSPSSPPSGR